nr:unnamed protein product [Digitaria exilis]
MAWQNQRLNVVTMLGVMKARLIGTVPRVAVLKNNYVRRTPSSRRPKESMGETMRASSLRGSPGSGSPSYVDPVATSGDRPMPRGAAPPGFSIICTIYLPPQPQKDTHPE